MSLKGKIKRNRKKVIVILIIAVVIILGIVGVAVWLHKGKDTKAGIQRTNTMTLKKMNLTTSVSATGTIESANSNTISADTTGVKIAKVNVAVGDSVSKGDVIVTFDKSDLEETLKEAQEELEEAKADLSKSISKANKQLSKSQSTYSSEKTKLAKKTAAAKKEVTEIKNKIKSINKKIKNTKNQQEKSKLKEQLTQLQEQLTQAKSSYEQAKENEENTNEQNSNSIDTASDSVDEATSNGNKTVKEARSKVKEAKENLEKCTVKATMSGVVTVLNVNKGDTYSGGTIAQIDDTSSFTVTTSVDEYDISKVKKGQKVIVLTEATDEDELEGEITFVAPSTSSSSTQSEGNENANTNTSSGYEVKIKMKDSDSRLRMGLTAKCSIVLEEADDVYAVPYDAIHEDSQGNSVIYVKDQSGSNTSKQTNDGTDNQNTTENVAQKEIQVTKGMESDYYVEVTGDDLQEGLEVIIPSDETSSNSDSSENNDFSQMMGGGAGMENGGGNQKGGNPGGAPGGNGMGK